MKTGVVKFFKNGQGKGSGFGFIIDDETQEEIFVHINGCMEQIMSGDNVTFDISPGKKGDQAINVRKA